MVVGYEAFPISDFKSGQVNVREPWLVPEDAFESLQNGFIKNGVLQKRLGYSQWAEMAHFVSAENIADTSQSASHTLSNLPVRSGVVGTVVITDSGGGPQTLTDDGEGGFTGDGTTSTINYTTGAIALEWDAVPTGAVQVSYSFVDGNAIMGIANHITPVGGSNLLVFDTQRVAKWDVLTSGLNDIPKADRFSGSTSQFFHWANWAGTLYFTNNSDVIDSYNGTSLSKPTVNLGAGNITLTCLLVFAYKDHLVCFRTTEDGTLHAQRARWATAGGIDFTNDGFVDAPTSEFINGGAFLNDELVIFFEKSIWLFKHTQNVDLPFRWEKIDSFSGSLAKHSILSFSNEVSAVSASNVISTDGLSARVENLKVPDAVQDFDQENFDLIYSIFLEELDLQFISYPNANSTTNDRMLVRNRVNNTWSIFTIGFHSLGGWTVDADLTWDGFGETTWDEVEPTWDANTGQAGFPVTLAGTTAGVVYKLNTTGADNTAAFEFSVKTKKLNPYVKKGFKARLGYVDLLVDRDDSVTLDVALFINEDSSAYQTDTLTFDDPSDSNDDKVWKRVYSGAIGEFHSMVLSKSATGQTPKIHAIIPYFLPVKGKFGV